MSNDDAAVLKLALDQNMRWASGPNGEKPTAFFVDESVSPISPLILGPPSLQRAKSDPLFNALLAENARPPLDLRDWLAQFVPAFPKIHARELTPPRDSFGVLHPFGIVVFARPAYSESRDTALLWYAALSFAPSEIGGPAFTPDDTVLRVERTPSGWRVAKIYAYSPD